MSNLFIIIIVWVGICLAAAGLPGLTLLLWVLTAIEYRRRKQLESEV